jgi:hypothetical protein
VCPDIHVFLKLFKALENMIGNTTNVGYPCHFTKSLILVKQNKGGETPSQKFGPHRCSKNILKIRNCLHG